MSPLPLPEGAALDGDERARLLAARALRESPAPDALGALKAARARERVRWVRVALDQAIEACDAVAAEQQVSSRDPEQESSEDNSQAYADGRRDGLRQALHELAPIIGLARAAAEELDEDAEVRAHLNQMRSVTAALRQLVSASAVPELREFDLIPVLRRLAEPPPVVCPDGLVGITEHGPFTVQGDPDLIELAVRPLLANAIEAVLSVAEDPGPSCVVLSCGAERAHYWIAVNDRGPGLPAKRDLFTLGATDKEGHSGIGLETAHTAIGSLGGEVELAEGRAGGATAIVRWPREA